MRISRRGNLPVAVAVLAMLAVATPPAVSQPKYPERPVRVIYPFAAGGDIVARILADELSKFFGKPFGLHPSGETPKSGTGCDWSLVRGSSRPRLVV